MSLKLPRSFQSYVNEMCGQMGLASNTIRFQTEKRDVPPSKIISQSCLIKMTHTYEFQQCPNKSLKPSLKSIFENETGYDTILKVQYKDKDKNETYAEFKVHKCILSVRSTIFDSLIKTATLSSKSDTSIIHINVNVTSVQGNLRPMVTLLLEWIYSASLDIPILVEDLSPLYFLAYEFKVFDLLTRCEHVLINRINPKNVIDILSVFFPEQ